MKQWEKQEENQERLVLQGLSQDEVLGGSTGQEVLTGDNGLQG